MNNIWNIFNEIKNEEESKETNDIIENKYDENICENCGDSSLIHDGSLLICNSCGLYQNRRLNTEIEYRYYGESDNKSVNPERLGMATNSLLPESSLGSVIGSRAYEKLFIKRMIRYDSWNKMPYKERSQYNVFTTITNLSKHNQLPPIIIEQSKAYYKLISENSISRGSNRNGLIAACVYMACRKENVPRTCKEIASIFNIPLHDMTKGCKKFKELLRMTNNNDLISYSNSNSIDYIDRFCSKINVNIDVKNMAEYVAIMIITQIPYLVEDNTSPSIAAVSIYIICHFCKLNITKKQISDSCKISEVTISKCFKKIEKYILELIPDKLKKEYVYTN